MSRSFALALLASSALAGPAARAVELPTGGRVAAGSASIAAASPGAMTITQGSDRAVIDWQSFSLGAGGRIDIVQPGSTSALLNRVTGTATSIIAGAINANGQVFLVNPNGILITGTGVVNAAGFVASTLDLGDKAFMVGEITVTGRGGGVVNRGAITIVKGGFAALIGGSVDNSGMIAAPLGRVALGTGTRATLDLTGDGFLQVAVPSASDGGITMSGRISADGGTVLLSAASAVDAARHTVNLSGTIEARGVSGHNGAVVLTGGDIALAGAAIDVSGDTGGGRVRIGGSRQGLGPLAHAATVAIDAASTIDASATRSGNGGDIVVWSDTATSFAGTIVAKGAGGGAGGDAEVSSHGRLAYTGSADLRGGRFGTLLLDPSNITISNDPDAASSGFTATGNDSVINAGTLTAALRLASVTVATGTTGTQAGIITIAAPLAWTTAATLTLQAAGAISLDADITAAAGGLTLSSGGVIGATGTVSVARFTLASGDWVQNATTLPGFATADFRITGGSFVRATGGAGTSLSPYLLTDIYGLQGAGSSGTLLGASWQLASDIDASGTAVWNGGAGFAPIGSLAAGFIGTLNGAGHVVSGLAINRPSTDNIGLVGYLYFGGKISGVGIVGGSITGYGAVGGLVGNNIGGTITQSYASAIVSGQSSVGGLIGFSTGIVNQSYATGTVSGRIYVGGLLGANENAVSQSYASGEVNGTTYFGGLVGHNGGSLTASYWDTDTSKLTNAVGFGRAAGAKGLTTVQARTAAGYTGFDFDTVWYQAGDLRPILRSEAAAATFGGEGPIPISNLHQLQLIGANLTGSYVLAHDIDATPSSGADAAGVFGPGGFVPIGNGDTQFNGLLVGAGHVISGLTIKSGLSDSVGLIGYLGVEGQISDIGLAGGSVAGSNAVGALVGSNYGSIDRAYATTVVTGAALVGGLVGDNHGAVRQSYATGAVTGSDYNVGGLAGESVGGVIERSYATGKVVGLAQVGGLVGGNFGTVSQSYATGTVSASIYGAGGLAGINDGTIGQSYATGSVTSMGTGNGMGSAGGLVGTNYINRSNGSPGTITGSYATGAVTGTNSILGGLVGDNGATLTSDYWDMETTGQGTAVGAGSADGATGLTTALARTSAGYADFDFGTVWYQAADLRPILRSEAATAVREVIPVANLHQLQLMALNLGGSYRLVADIDASPTSGADAAGIFGTGGFVPVSDYHSHFTGTLNGAGHVVSGLAINRPSTNYVGLVGYLDVGGTISGIGIAGGAVSGGLIAGGLAGASKGTISQSYATGAVSGVIEVGGLAGASTGTISQSYATGAVSGTGDYVGGLAGVNVGTISQSYATGAIGGTGDYVGGLAGFNTDTGTISQSYATGAVSGTGIYEGGLAGINAGTISQSYATGAVSGTQSVGGLAGGNIGTISQSYAAGAASGTTYVGGLVGDNTDGVGKNGTLATSYWDTAASGQSNAVGNGSATGATGLNTAQMHDVIAFRANFAGFDFDTVWAPPSDAAHSSDARPHYPELYALSKVIAATTGSETRVYGDAAGPLSLATYTGARQFDFVTALGSVAIPAVSNVGDNPIVLAGVQTRAADGTSYRIVTIPGTDTVTARPVTITAAAQTRPYGDANPALTFAATSLGAGAALSGALATLAAATSNIGGYDITQGTLTAAANPNYSLSYTGNTLTVTTRPISVTADAATRIYGNANPALTYTVGGSGLVNGDMLSGGLITGAALASNVGGYAIGQGSLAASSNYALGYTAATLTVIARPISVTADAGTRIYGNANPALTYTVGGSGLVNGDTLSGGLTTGATLASNVGGYAITQGSLAATSNYALGYTAATLTVTPRAISVAADAGTSIYGNANPALTYTVGGSGLVNGDTLSGGLITGAALASNVGDYAITQGSLAASGNYTLTSYTPGTLSITPRPVTVTADPLSRFYGDANPALTFTTTSLGAGTALIGALATAAAAASNVAGYAITQGSLTTAANPNYSLTYVGNTLSVAARPVTVTANAQTRLYGNANPALTYTVGGSGLINGDTLSGGLAAAATLMSSVGGYAITQGSLAASGNYSVGYTAATLTVTTRPILVTADAATRIYGNANPALTYTVGGSGLVNGDTLSGGLATAAARTSSVGGYAITQGSLAASGNYSVTSYAPATLTVTPRALVITPDAASRLYGNASPASGTASGDNFVNGDSVTLVALSAPATAASNVGGYDLTASAAAGGGLGNYAISYAIRTGGLSVTARPITVTADGKSRAYGDANPALTYTVGGNGLVNGDTLTGGLTTAASGTSGIGGYAIARGTFAASANYAVGYAAAVLTIAPRPLLITGDAKTRLFGEANPALTYMVGDRGLVNGDVLTGALAVVAGSTSVPGAYQIAQATLAASPNYALSYAPGVLTV